MEIWKGQQPILKCLYNNIFTRFAIVYNSITAGPMIRSGELHSSGMLCIWWSLLMQAVLSQSVLLGYLATFWKTQWSHYVAFYTVTTATQNNGILLLSEVETQNAVTATPPQWWKVYFTPWPIHAVKHMTSWWYSKACLSLTIVGT